MPIVGTIRALSPVAVVLKSWRRPWAPVCGGRPTIAMSAGWTDIIRSSRECRTTSFTTDWCPSETSWPTNFRGSSSCAEPPTHSIRATEMQVPAGAQRLHSGLSRAANHLATTAEAEAMARLNHGGIEAVQHRADEVFRSCRKQKTASARIDDVEPPAGIEPATFPLRVHEG